jgi:hypothetical protein
VITVFIGSHRNGENTVAPHHFFVAVAFHAYQGMKSFVSRGVGRPGPDLVESVAVAAGRGVLIAGHDRSAVDGLQILGAFLGMTLPAFLRDFPFVVFPVVHGVDVGVAVGTGYVAMHMNACIMFGSDRFVASGTLNLADDRLTLFMSGNIDQFHVAACAGIPAVNGCAEGRDRNLVSMAAQAD